jgi:prepilin-type N-terminal cleavage/methylation domain-containing protein
MSDHEPQGSAATRQSSGFTLIELSIVLVIIGLIIGGILTGQSLIDAAAQRTQISQISKYNAAVQAFQTKYGGYLPGDIPDPTASNFGFQSRGQYAGEGDGNGIIEGNCFNAANQNRGNWTGCGELAVFWQDLSTAGLIDTTINQGITWQPPWPYPTLASNPGIKDWLPAAKLGQGVFLYIFSMNGINYFSLSSVTLIDWSVHSTSNPGLTVQQAYNIDKKIDDGLPQSGSITACYLNRNIQADINIWAAGGQVEGAGGAQTGFDNCVPTQAATPYASTNCFDNNGVAGTQTYSISQNASAQNCALSFKFQ